MKSQRVEKIRVLIWILISLAISAVFFSVVYVKTGFTYQTIDDIYISDIYKGRITGTPDYHTIYNGVLFAIPLMVLYKINASAPWFGIALFIIQYLSMVFPLIAVLTSCKRYYEKLVSVVALCISNAILIYLISFTQYTSTAMWAAMAGYACLLLSKDKKWGYISFGVLEALAHGLRTPSMQIIQPIGYTLVAGYVVWMLVHNKEMNKKERIGLLVKEAAIPLAIVLGIMLIGKVAYSIGYGNQEWREAISVNDARTVMFDFYGVPKADEIEDILDECGVEKIEYEAYVTYMNYDWENDNGVIEKAAEYRVATNPREYDIPAALKWLFMNYKNWPWKLHRVLLAAAIFELMVIIVYRRPGALLMNLANVIGKVVSGSYLILRGRLPDRVTIPFFYSEIASVIIIALVVVLIGRKPVEGRNPEVKSDNENNDKSDEQLNSKIGNIVIPSTMFLGIILMCVFGFKTTQEEYRYINSEKYYTDIWKKLPDEFADYCNSNPDNRYLLTNVDFRYWLRDTFDAYPAYDNYLYCGGWHVAIPEAQLYAEEYLNSGDLYYIAPDVQGEGIEKQLEYLEWKYGNEPVVVDEISLSTGMIYYVYLIK